MAERDFSKFAHTFWTGETGRRLRQLGNDAQLAAAYLITCQNSNAIGLYYLPIPIMAHELGWTFDRTRKALQRVSEGGFATYDEAAEEVWVPHMAEKQIGQTLKAGDNNIKWVQKQLDGRRNSRFLPQFYEIYGEAYHLDPRPLQAPSEVLQRGSPIEIEIEIEKEIDNSSEPQAASEPNEDPVRLEFPTVGDAQSWDLRQSFIDELKRAYPALDIREQCYKAHVWLVANPAKRKTPRGMPRFLNGWMERSQNNGKAQPLLPATPAYMQEQP